MEDDMQSDKTNMQNEGKKTDADEVKENVKQTVAKGVAAVAGAIKGFTEEAKKHDLAGSTKEAIQKAGETTREVAGTAKKEFGRTKEHLSGDRPDLSGSNVGGSSSSSSSMGSSSVPDLRKTPLGSQSDIKEKSGSLSSSYDSEDDSSSSE